MTAGGYPTQDAAARAGSYLLKAPAHVDREHVRKDGRLWVVTQGGGLSSCYDPECVERYPACGRVVCSDAGIGTHEVVTVSGFRATLCDTDTGWYAANRTDPVDVIRCLADTAYDAAAMPGECTCGITRPNTE